MKILKGNNMDSIETDRLILRKFVFSDKDDLFEIMSDEQTSLDDGGYHACKGQDKEYLALMEILSAQRRFSIILKENQKMIGMINLQDDARAVASYELGFVYEGKEHKAFNHAVYGPIDLLCYYKDRDEEVR